MSDHHVRWSSHQWWISYVDHIYYMTHVRPFGLQCSETMYIHARLVKFNPSILHVQNYLTPIVLSLSHPIITWCLGTTNCRNGAYLGRTLIPWNFSEGSSYNATIVLSKIRCIKDKHHMRSKYVTWCGHHHLVPLISISKAPSWSPLSPAWHLDLHRSVVVVSPTIASTTIANA